MLNNLTKEQFDLLVSKNIIQENGYFRIYGDNNGDYRINEIIKENDCYKFSVKNIDTMRDSIINQNQISAIEDMSIYRIMEAYMVDEELNTHDIIKKTDIAKNIIGQKYAKIDGIELVDGDKLILHKDVNEKYNGKVLTVSGVGSSIKLSAPRGRPKKNK